LLILIAQHTKHKLLISIVSESLPHLRKGAIRDFFNILGSTPKDDPRYNMSEHTYNFGNGVIEFFGADEADKVRGPRRDILFINEGNNVSWETARGLDIRTRLLTIVDWNPVSEFWAHQYESGNEIVKGWLHETTSAYIHSTYLDAIDVIPAEIVANIESNRDKDPNWWNIYGLGKMGKVTGLVYPLFGQVDVLPYGDYFYGLDWGFSGDPTALTKHVIVGDNLYSQELIYEKELTNQDIGNRLDELGVIRNHDEIWADSAEPKSIEEVYSHKADEGKPHFNIKGTPKGPGSVRTGHKRVMDFRQFWTKDSTNCIKEQRNYRYIPDRNGKLTDKTTHNFSHGMDARRYAIMGAFEPVEEETIQIYDAMAGVNLDL